MDQRIFVKEQVEPGRNKIAIAVFAVALLVVGLGGLIVILSNNSQPGSTTSPSAKASVAASAKVTSTPIVTSNPNTSPTTVPTPTPVASPTITSSPTAAIYTAPTDTTKINIYFPKTPETDSNPNQLMPVLRDKPDTKLETFTLNQIFSGLTAAEKTAGYKTTWNFAGTSNCSGGTYKYAFSGKTLTVTLCKEFTGSSASLFISAITHTLVEQGKFSKISVLTTAGDCLGLAAGDKSCL